MAYLPSPRGGEDTTFPDHDSNPDFGTMMESFQSPGVDPRIGRGGVGAGNLRRPAAKPLTPLLSKRTNVRDEFTPLLKSVHRSNMKGAVGGGGVPMPDFLRPGAKLGSSPILPQGSDDGDTTSFQGDATTQLPDDVSQGTPIGKLSGGNAQLGGDGLMTLREQEKVIDDIKKENFSLKLKVFFLNERLEKLGPEWNEAALKENVEIKVERATLKAELQRCRKQLKEAEKAIEKMRADMMSSGKASDSDYASARRSEEEARLREELQQKLDSVQADLDQALDDIDELRANEEKMRHRMEIDGGNEEELEKLRKELERVEDEKGDLEAELREKEREIDGHQDQIEEVEQEGRKKGKGVGGDAGSWRGG
ncbi:microtubule associated-domain-containing protein [Pyronema domesticum]|nr:microtubule associated-domain-containing protein [Pyronema domesticum]